MRWENFFSDQGRKLSPNPIREFIKLARRPGMISFAGGLPAPELFPIEEIRAAADELLRHHGRQVLQYSESDGIPELREYIASEYRKQDVPLTAENILITSGAQQGLDLIGRLFINPGDAVAVENPTYLTLLSCWRILGATFQLLAQNHASVPHHPKLIYLVPNFQNPTGATLPLDSRLELLKLAATANALLIEDDPYGALRYEGDPIPSLLQLQKESGAEVIQLGTYSKTLAPGLRIGWIAAPRSVIEKLVYLKQSADLHTSTLNQHITLALLRAGVYERQLASLRREYHTRLKAMLEGLDQLALPGVSWTRPEGGMFAFLTLPPQSDAGSLLTEAVSRNVIFVPGAPFHIRGGQNTIRLNFSNPNPGQIQTGIKNLGEVIASHTAPSRTNRPGMTSALAEESAVGEAGGPTFDGTGFLSSPRK